MRFVLNAIKWIFAPVGHLLGLLGDAKFAAQLGLERGDGLPCKTYIFDWMGTRVEVKAGSWMDAADWMENNCGPVFHYIGSARPTDRTAA